MLFRVVYFSSAVVPFSEKELLELLTQSRENNNKLGITGLLLYKEGCFIQVIDGEQSAICDLFAKILQDPRHKQIITVVEEAIDSPLFPDWSMGFRNLHDSELLNTPGFSPIMNNVFSQQNVNHDPSGCMALLNFFRTGR